MNGGTIAARASSVGTGDRAVIRLSGSLDTIEHLFAPMPASRGVVRTMLDLGRVRLPCVALRFVAPKSYTGEDGLELLIPGGPAIIDRVMQTLLACEGVRPAEPGEFSARAYVAGKLTLDEARGVEATIAASNQAQLVAADRLLSGELGRAARRWAERITHLLALVEAGIDFTDQEDVTAIESDALAGELGSLRAEIASELGADRGSERRAGVPMVVLVGPASAGKSTLFNALLGRRRAITHAEPGTTRDALAEPLTLPGGIEIELVDLPGLDGSAGARLAQERIESADVVLACDEFGTFDPHSDDRTIRVRTKADRASTVETGNALPVCGLSGEGLADVKRAIASACRSLAGDDGSLPTSVAARLRGCVDAVTDANAMAHGDAELIADRLRLALDELGAITGRVDPDAVLGRVFASFCVGK
ncbi:MAG: GTPase [Planctomycetota bacterium]